MLWLGYNNTSDLLSLWAVSWGEGPLVLPTTSLPPPARYVMWRFDFTPTPPLIERHMKILHILHMLCHIV